MSRVFILTNKHRKCKHFLLAFSTFLHYMSCFFFLYLLLSRLSAIPYAFLADKQKQSNHSPNNYRINDIRKVWPLLYHFRSFRRMYIFFPLFKSLIRKPRLLLCQRHLVLRCIRITGPEAERSADIFLGLRIHMAA